MALLSSNITQQNLFKEIENNHLQQVQDTVHILQGTVQRFLMHDDLIGVRETISAISAEPDLTKLVVVDQHGKIIASNDYADLDEPWTILGLNANTIASVQHLDKTVVITDYANQYMEAYAPTCNGNAAFLQMIPSAFECGFLYYKTDLSYHQKQAETQIAQLTRYNLIAAGFLFSIIWFFSIQIIQRPMMKITQAMRDFAIGNKASRTTITGSNELAALAEQTNQLLEQLQHDEENLSKSEKRLRSIIDNVNVMMIATDTHGIIQTFNQCAEQRLGYQASHLIGVETPLLWHDRNEVIEQTQRLNKQYGLSLEPGMQTFFTPTRLGKNQPFEWTFITAEGDRFPVKLMVLTLTDIHDDIIGYVGLAEDLTEHKANEAWHLQHEQSLLEFSSRMEQKNVIIQAALEQAEAANVTKSRFLATMSHEIRTPMNGVLGMAEALSQTPLNAKQQEYISVISSSGKTLLTIINDILDYSKMEAGKLEMDPHSFHLPTMIKEICQLLQFNLNNKPIQLISRIDDEVPPHLIGDSMRIRQVLLNLIGNAIKFTERGHILIHISGKVECTNHESFCHLRIEIEDTGIGLSREQQKNLFEAFSQADISTTRKFGGTGLGLSISKQLIELMHGTIGVRSTLGEGSLFWFKLFLPIDLQEHHPESQVQKHLPLELSPLKGKLLLVDDDPLNVMVAEALLGDQDGLEISVAHHGLEAIKMWEEHGYDLILMDCQMPVMDGLTASIKLRKKESQMEGMPHIPIIALTANAQQSDRADCLNAGMDDFLAKPFQQEDILTIIRKWLKQA